jgi:hypothetical protein
VRRPEAQHGKIVPTPLKRWVELVASRRLPIFGGWSIPMVIRAGAAGMTLLRSAQASDGDGGLMALWSEAPDASGGGPLPAETPLSSQYDPALGAWGAALAVDAGQHYYSPAVASIGTFDSAADRWSAPSLIGVTPRGLPVSPAIHSDGQGTVAAAWSVSQGDGGPFLNATDASGAWQGAVQLDPVGVGFAPDLPSSRPATS